MTSDGVTLGSAALIGARRRARLTQEQLADQAGLSIRALRDLETGRATAPRQSSLELLAGALGFDAAQTATFLDCWNAAPGLISFTEVNLAGHDVDTLFALERAAGAGLRDLAVFEETTIGPDRLLSTNRNTVAVEALDREVRRRIIIWSDQPSFDPSRISLSGLTGVRLAAATTLPDYGLGAFELEFERPIAPGERRTFAFTVDVDRAPPPGGTVPEAMTLAEHGFRRPVDVYSLRVQFDGAVPDRCWELTRTLRRGRHLRPVPIHDNCLDFVRQTLEPGNYGFEWVWDAST